MCVPKWKDLYPPADIYADIEDESTLPEDRFDCIIATQVLVYMYDVELCLRNLKKLMKPGGVLIITVPGCAKHSNYMMIAYTEKLLKQLCMSTFGNYDDFQAYGSLEVLIRMLLGVRGNRYEKPASNDYKYSTILGIVAKNQ